MALIFIKAFTSHVPHAQKNKSLSCSDTNQTQIDFRKNRKAHQHVCFQ